MPIGTTKRGALRTGRAAQFPQLQLIEHTHQGDENMPHRAPKSRYHAPQPRRGLHGVEGALACSPLIWGACFAQEGPPAPPPGAENAQSAPASVGLEEVVVTATRRSEVESK